MVKTSQIIFAKGKAKALDSLFLDSENDKAPFGYLAVGFSDAQVNGFEDPILNDTNMTNEEYTGFKELDATRFNYHRVELRGSDLNYEDINYNDATGKVTRTYQATLESDNINETYINQIAIVNTSEANNNMTEFYSATTFPSFLKDSHSSITFKISFTI